MGTPLELEGGPNRLRPGFRTQGVMKVLDLPPTLEPDKESWQPGLEGMHRLATSHGGNL